MFFYQLKKRILRRIVPSSLLTYSMRNFVLRQMGVIIGEDTVISHNFKLADRAIDKNLLVIGNHVDIAGNVSVLTTTGPMRSKIKNIYPLKAEKVIISDHVWIGMNATIMNGVTIGECSIIGTNCVVDKDVPPYSVAKGNPMQITKMPKVLIEELKNIK